MNKKYLKTTLTSMFVFATLLMGAACNKPMKSTVTGQSVPTIAPNENLTPDGKAIYPHTDEFKKKEHGKLYLQQKASCVKCHGQEMTGGVPKVACKNCHAGFPHVANWGEPAVHGKFFRDLNNDNRDQCLKCHTPPPLDGSALRGNPDILSCQGCHAPYPHDTEFKRGGHGKLAHGNVSSCVNCHNKVNEDTSIAPDRKVTCQRCHGESVPHSKDWANPQVHGVFFAGLTSKLKTNCLKCHSPEEKSQMACQTCHAVYPHTEDFKDGGHKELAEKSLSLCLQCHTDFKRNVADSAGCFGCHDKSEYIPILFPGDPVPADPAPTPSPDNALNKSKVKVPHSIVNKAKDSNRVPTSTDKDKK